MTYILKNVSDLALPEDFDCTEPALNQFLLQHAKENQVRGLSSTHLFCEKENEQNEPKILGYFSLSTTSISIDQLDPRLTKRYPNYIKNNLTVTLFARLALDKKYQGKRLGEILMIHMFKTVVRGWDYINSIGLLVHAKHEKAAKSYEDYGFRRLPQNNLHLFMPRREVLNIVKQTQIDS